MVSKGLYLTLNTININAYHKLPTFLHGTTRKVLFTSDKIYWEVTKYFFPCYFICPGGNGEGWNCVRVQMFWAMQGEPSNWLMTNSSCLFKENLGESVYMKKQSRGTFYKPKCICIPYICVKKYYSTFNIVWNSHSSKMQSNWFSILHFSLLY